MTGRELLKTTEGGVVLGGLLLTVLFGKFIAVLTAGAYLLINVEGWWPKVVSFFKQRK